MALIGDILYILFAIVLGMYAIYYFIYCFIAIAHPLRTYKETDHEHVFAAVIPARNEEKVIGNLISSLKKQDYSSDKLEIYVVSDHCIDHTESAALSNGAKIIRCTKDTSTKGEVLKDAFSKLSSNTNIEAYVIFDADNVADKNFIKRMNEVYDAGYHIAQGRRTGKNRKDNAITKCYEIFYTMQNIFFNHARGCVDQSSSLNGTGWMVSKEDIDTYGFDTCTLTEDLEYAAIAAMRKETIAYVPAAVTYDEYTDDVKMSIRQIERWVYGQSQGMKAYWKPLWKSFIKDHSRESGAVLSFFTMAYAVICLFALLIIAIVFHPMHIGYVLASIPWYVYLLILYVWLVINEVIGVYKSKLKVTEMLTGIVFFPVFIVSWLPIAVVCTFKKDYTWKPIIHDRNIKIEDLK